MKISVLYAIKHFIDLSQQTAIILFAINASYNHYLLMINVLFAELK